MKKLLPISIFFLFFSFSAFAQRLASENCIGTDKNDNIVGTHENDDSTTTLFLQHTENNLDFEFSIIKLDRNKNIILDKKLDSLFIEAIAANFLFDFDKDGSLLVFASDFLRAYKYDKNGNYLWKADSLETADVSKFVKKADGGYLFYTYNTIYEKDVLSISNTGKFLWKKHFSLINVIPPDPYNQSSISVQPLKSKNVLIVTTVSKGSFMGWGYDTTRSIIYLTDSSGNIIKVDSSGTLSVSPYESGIDFSSSDYLIGYSSLFFGDILLLDINNLSVINSDSASLNEIILSSYKSKLEDTTRLYVFPYFQSDSMIYCMDIHFNRLWSYQLTHNYGPFNQDFLLLNNRKIFIDRSLIDDGNKLWESNVEIIDTLFLNGKTWYKSSAVVQQDYNGKDISYTINYLDDINGFATDGFSLIQIIDINTGHVKEKMIINLYNYRYINHYSAGHVVAVTETGCGFGGYDIHFGYYSNDYNAIQGVTYIDYNHNNVMDSLEPTYPWGYAHTKNGSDSLMMHLYNDGQFIFYADTGTYTTRISLYNDYFDITPQQVVTTHHNYGNADTLFFALTPQEGKNDLSVQLVDDWVTRIGKDNTYTLTLSNRGAGKGSGKLKLLMDPRLLLSQVTPTYDYTSGDTMVWNITDLFPSQSRNYTILFVANIPPALNAGDTVVSQAWIEYDSTDIMPGDNYTALREGIRASYDPNEKTILSGATLTPAQITNGDFISYIVHFQNTGNDTAFKVIVVDTLSSNVDVNSLQIIGASAPYTLEIIQDRILKFTFENIRLSFDTLSLSSTGYIAYKIKAKPTVSIGNTIDNTANIFFDYNRPIRTNTVQTQVLLLSAVHEVKKQNGTMNIYPNPNSGTFTISYEKKNTVELRLQLIDITGNIIYEERKYHSDKTEFTIHQNDLAKGIYWIKLNDGSDIYSRAIVIQ